jgi:hypothetical protein
METIRKNSVLLDSLLREIWGICSKTIETGAEFRINKVIILAKRKTALSTESMLSGLRRGPSIIVKVLFHGNVKWIVVM